MDHPASKYIKLPDSSDSLRHWIGYRREDPSLFFGDDNKSTDDKLLLMFAAIALRTPREKTIPKEISDRFHVDSFYFRIYRERKDSLYSPMLLYSESYVEIMREIEKRGLVEILGVLRKGYKEGPVIVSSFADDVPSPAESKLLGLIEKED